MSKFSPKFNIIDLAVVILVIAVVVSNIYLFIRKNGVFTKVDYDITYTVAIENIDPEHVGNIRIGDTLRDRNSAFPLGNITSVKIRDDSRGISTMEITVNAQAERHNGVLYVNGVQIYVGQQIDIRVPDLVCKGRCTLVTFN